MDLLEKRVKSRFSHRQYCLFPAKSFEIFLQIARNSLTLTTESMDEDYKNAFNEELNACIYNFIFFVYSPNHTNLVYIHFNNHRICLITIVSEK